MGDVKKETPEWHRADSDRSVLLYTLKQDGWRKGHPSMVNDMMVRIENASGSDHDLAPIADAILLSLRQPDTSERGGVKVGDTVRILRARNAYGQDVSIGKPFAIGETFVVGSVQDDESFLSGIVFPEGENCEFWRADDLEIISSPPPNKSPNPEHVEGDVSVGEMEVVAWAREVDINGPCLINPAFLSKGAVDLFKYGNAGANKHARFVELVRRSEAADALSSAQSSIQRAERERDDLRFVVSECAGAIGNGAIISTDASLDFMKLLPTEIRSALLNLRAREYALKARLEEARKVLKDALHFISDIDNSHKTARSIRDLIASFREKQDAE